MFLIAPAGKAVQLLKDFLEQELGIRCIAAQNGLTRSASSDKKVSTGLNNSVLHFESICDLDYLDIATASARREGLDIHWLYLLTQINPAAIATPDTGESDTTETAEELQPLCWLEFNTEFLDRLDELDCLFVDEGALLRDSKHYLDLIRGRIESSSDSMTISAERNEEPGRRCSSSAQCGPEVETICPDHKPSFEMNASQKDLIVKALLEHIPAQNQQDNLTEEDKTLASLQNSRRHASIPGTHRAKTKTRVVYISEDSHSRGHIYRVSQMIQGLHYHGFDALWLTPRDALNMQHLLDSALLVVLYRCSMSKEVQDIYAHCKLNKVSTAFDIDDYLFDQEIITEGYFHYYSQLQEHDKRVWRTRIGGYRSQIVLADYCFAPTSALAQAMRKHNPNTIVLPNAYSPTTARLSTRWAESRRDSTSDRIVIGYMSGTPTHDADFSQIAPTVFGLLRRYPHYNLRITGHLNLQPYLGMYSPTQVEVRPLVEHVNFSYELAMLDLLLIPLKLNNPFCDAKSPLKWFEAAIAGTPSICTANPTYTEIVSDGANGYLCSTPNDWENAIRQLCDSSSLRVKIAKQASLDAARFSVRSAIKAILPLLASIKGSNHGQKTSSAKTI